MQCKQTHQALKVITSKIIGFLATSMDRTSRCNKVDVVRLYASYRLNFLLLKGQRCVRIAIICFSIPQFSGYHCTSNNIYQIAMINNSAELRIWIPISLLVKNTVNNIKKQNKNNNVIRYAYKYIHIYWLYENNISPYLLNYIYMYKIFIYVCIHLDCLGLFFYLINVKTTEPIYPNYVSV